ncbi:hypothetical protein MMC17_005550 [Xylographa soralifera]|nr:hypothetical protein [Xylographa soralifera]
MDHAQEELQRKLYLNRGRVLLVDPSRSKEIQEKAHRGVWFDMPSTKFTESTIARNTRSKNPLAAGILPATWAINKLADAKAAYTTRRPPFVQQKGRLNIEKAGRIVTLADKQGRLPENVRIAEFRAHAWDKSDFFWTLDLEDTRWIVKAYGGGPQGGITYRKWLGVRDGFSEKPVAFSLKQAERGGEILPPDVVFPTKPHKKAEIDTIRLATSADTPSEGYSDLDVDEVLAAILSDEPAEIELAAKTITDDASPVIEIIDLTARPTSVPKKQLGFEKDSGGECRFELNRSKKGKKRQSDESKYDNSSAGSTSGNVRKRLCVTESSQPLEQAQERDDGINLLRFDPFKPRLDSIVTKDVVESMERASLDPEVSCKATAMNSQESCDKVQGDNDTQHIDAALKPHWSLKTERESSQLVRGQSGYRDVPWDGAG